MKQELHCSNLILHISWGKSSCALLLRVFCASFIGTGLNNAPCRRSLSPVASSLCRPRPRCRQVALRAQAQRTGSREALPPPVAPRGGARPLALPFLSLRFFQSLLLCSFECFQQRFISVIWEINYGRRCLAGDFPETGREWDWCCRADLLPSLCLADVSGCPVKECVSTWFCTRLQLVFMSRVSSPCCWCVSISKYECKLTNSNTRTCFVPG